MRQYGFSVTVSDRSLANKRVLGHQDHREGEVRAVALGAAMAVPSADRDWILNHPLLKVEVQRDASLRRYDVYFVVTTDDDEIPPSTCHQLAKGVIILPSIDL